MNLIEFLVLTIWAAMAAGSPLDRGVNFPPLEERPQIILISMDEAIKAAEIDRYIKPAYVGRKNPNGCQIGATFFVPHQWTDYSKVHELYSYGFEIGSNSISKNYQTEYWMTANVTQLRKEFGGQKTILEHFAGIPIQNISGARTPNLQLAGDNTFDALASERFVYDSSWPTMSEGKWPYHPSGFIGQECPIPPCPQRPHPDVWELPLNDWVDQNGIFCATIAGCQSIPHDESDIYDWLISNFERVYTNTKTPFNIALNTAVFQKNPRFYTPYLMFLDYLATLNDVYILNMSQAIEWFMKPKPIDDPELFTCAPQIQHRPELTKVCPLKPNPEATLLFMPVYNTSCPDYYPSLDNPLGTKK